MAAKVSPSASEEAGPELDAQGPVPCSQYLVAKRFMSLPVRQ